MPGLTIGDPVPNLEVETTHGKLKLHDYVGNSYVIIFSHPADFTPVCITEMGMMAVYANKFEERGVKILGVSCDDVQSHIEWIKDIKAYNREIIKQLNMVDLEEKDASGVILPSRALRLVGSNKIIKLSFLYPACTGRNMDEVLRVVDSVQMAAKHKVATSANWKPRDPMVISPSVSNDQAKEMFLQGYNIADLPSKKDYLRFTTV